MIVDVNPVVENTTMQKYIDDNTKEDRTYWIKPNEGYKLHDKVLDSEDIDPDTGESVNVLGFNTGISTCSANYDFTANPREFYTVPVTPIEEEKACQ